MWNGVYIVFYCFVVFLLNIMLNLLLDMFININNFY